MIFTVLWRFLRKEIRLMLALGLLFYPALLVQQTDIGIERSLLPISFVAALFGWWGAGAKSNGRHTAWGLNIVGFSGVFVYIVGLARPLLRFILFGLSIFWQSLRWLYLRTPISVELFREQSVDLLSRILVSLSRMWAWSLAVFSGDPLVDPSAAALVFGILFWVAGSWAAWQLRRRQAVLRAFLPSVLLLLYTVERGITDIWSLAVFLGALLFLLAISSHDQRLAQWHRKKVDYADSVAFDTAVLTIPVVMLLVTAAALAQSVRWQDIVDIFERRQASQSVQNTAPSRVPSPLPEFDESPLMEGLPRLFLLTATPAMLDELVMSVHVVGETDAHPYYWRTITYERYMGQGWVNRSIDETFLPAETALSGDQREILLEQSFVRIADGDRSFYWAGELVQVDADARLFWRRLPTQNDVGDLLTAVGATDVYTVISDFSQPSVEALQTTKRTYPIEISSRYLALPDSVPDRVRVLAEEITGRAQTPYEQALALESYLRDLPYTLDISPPPFEQDLVDYFLFTTQRGYCDYFASSMVVMARSVGLPARIVTGYLGSEYDAETDQYLVRQKDAHTWVEIYFSGIGWVEFEPTASLPSSSTIDGEMPVSQLDNMPEDVPSSTEKVWHKWHLERGWQSFYVLVTLFLVVIILVFGQGLYLYLSGSERTLETIYARLIKVTQKFLPDLPDEFTALELQVTLVERMNTLSQTRFGKLLLRNAGEQVETITNLYMLHSYSEQEVSQLDLRRVIWLWPSLRWMLWAASFVEK